jgi:hypothetical protein
MGVQSGGFVPTITRSTPGVNTGVNALCYRVTHPTLPGQGNAVVKGFFDADGPGRAGLCAVHPARAAPARGPVWLSCVATLVSIAAGSTAQQMYAEQTLSCASFPYVFFSFLTTWL